MNSQLTVECWTAYHSASESYKAAEQHLKKITARLAEVEAAGMYPAVPSETWEAKSAAPEGKTPKKDYLYMLFKCGSNGQYQGPDGKRRVAVGRDEAKIVEARRLAHNRAQWEALTAQRRNLESWIQNQARRLRELEAFASQWPRANAELLGTAGTAQRDGAVPNETLKVRSESIDPTDKR